jgi:hypothetical protein
MELGGKSIYEEDVNLNIPQKASFYFMVVHKDASGNVVDHSGSTIHMSLQSKDGKTNYDMSQYCAATAQAITVNIPASATADLPIGKKSLNWDIFATTQSGGQNRLCDGVVNVYDTYAMDCQE